MASWLPSFLRKTDPERPPPVLELLVVEGRDTGRQFTVDADELAIGQAAKADDRSVGIHLNDPTVSARQAVLRADPGGSFILEHVRGATNPTRLNGKPIDREAIAPGDRIEMGNVAMDVRPHDGMALSGLTRLPKNPSSRSTRNQRATASPPEPTVRVAAPGDPEAASEASGFFLKHAHQGARRRYPIQRGINRVGRHADCHIQTPEDELAISRHHADVVWDGEELFVVHRSETNATSVNGQPVTGRVAVETGDRIELAGLLAFEVGYATPPGADDAERASLRNRMEDVLDLEKRIQADFAVQGTFLDVDIAGSSTMKTEKIRPEHIILSFERWRGWIRRVIEDSDGQVLCSNGDELMCFFETGQHADRAVQAGHDMLEQLGKFNATENLLPEAFRIRVGIHTGRSLVDRRMGIAYSSVLDVAGHLQKEAAVDGLLASQQTYEAMSEDHLLEREGELEREGIPTYRLRA